MSARDQSSQSCARQRAISYCSCNIIIVLSDFLLGLKSDNFVVSPSSNRLPHIIMPFSINNLALNVSYSDDALPSRLSPSFASCLPHNVTSSFYATVSCDDSEQGFSCALNFIVDGSLIHYDAVFGPEFASQRSTTAQSSLVATIPRYPGGYLSKFLIL
jgi:hypothetical protein